MKIKLFYLLTLFITLSSFSQNSSQQKMNDLTPISPTASTIATYVDYPVDYKTGVPNISIPLFEVSTKIGTIPFSLSYHVGKIKSSEFTGPVGLGWSLMPEMGITRSKRGKEDDMPMGYDVPVNSPTCSDQLKSAQGLFNTEPDDFYYSLLSKQGKFLYNKTNNFSTIPFEAIKISRSDRYSFSIIDNDGSSYKFGKDYLGNQIVEISNHSVGETQSLDSWKITEIKSFDGAETIRFLYNSPSSRKIISFLSQYKISHNLNCSALDLCNDFIKKTIFNGSSYENYTKFGWLYMKPAYSGNVSTNYNFKNYTDIAPYPADASGEFGLVDFATPLYIQPTYDPAPPLVRGLAPEADSNVIQEHTINELPLKEITFSSGKVTYEYSGNKLKKLSLFNLTGGVYQLLKYVIFTYSDLSRDSRYEFILNYNMDRYTLDKVEIYDAAGKLFSNYKLEYTSRSITYIPLGINTACDIWGFPYRGYIDSMPEMNIELKVAAANGVVGNLAPMNVKIGTQRFELVNDSEIPSEFPPLLKKITYPTGGSSEFTFERNQFKNLNSSNGIGIKAGGFRISKIRYLTDQNPAKTKIYKYGINESGYGEVKYFPNKGDFMYDQVFKNALGNTYVETTINSSPFKSLMFSGGAAVIYPEVNEYEATLNSNGEIVDYNGKTKYEYFLAGIGGLRRPFTPLQYEYRDEWSYSYLKKKSITDRTNKLIMDETYDYNIIRTDSIPVLQSFQRYSSTDNSENICQSYVYPTYGGYTLLGNNSPVEYIKYDIRAGILLLKNKTTALYNGNNSISTFQTFKYDPDNFLLKNTVTATNGIDSLQTKNYYPKDLIARSFMSNLIAANRINTPVKIEELKNNIKISETSTSYIQNASTSNLLLPQSVYSNKGLSIIDLSVNLDKKITYDLYDGNGNLNQYTTENGVPVSFIWGYNKTKPIAKIENAAYASITASLITAAQSKSNTDTQANLITALNAIRSNLPTAMVTTYTYIPLIGVSTVTDPKGLTTYYEYDSFGRLQYIKDKDLNVLQRNCYNYLGQLTDCSVSGAVTTYKNILRSSTFTKQGCSGGTVGSTYVYSVPAGIYSSTISQADANAQADSEIAANGQNVANANGSCLAVPAVPTGLAFTSATANSINFSWNAVAGATSYKIYKNGVHVSTVTSTTGSLLLLAASTSYNIQVSATNVSVDGGLSASVTMSTAPALATPAWVTVINITSSTLNFAWEAVSGATGYKIYKNGVLATDISTNSILLSGLSASTTYIIQVAATNGSDEGPLSAARSMTTTAAGPVAPTGLVLTSATATALNFSWNSVTGATGYRIYKNGVYVSSVTSTAGSLSGLMPSTDYVVQVLAYNAAGDGTLSGSVSMRTATGILGFYKTSGTYPTINASTLNGSIFNKLTSPIYIYAVAQGSSGTGSVSINGISLSVSGGQNLVSTNYAMIAAGATVTATGNYSGAGSMILGYSLAPGAPITYWSNSN